MRAKYTHRTNLRFVLCVFRDCIELKTKTKTKISPDTGQVHKRLPMQPWTEGSGAYKQKFICTDVKIDELERQDQLYLQ